MISWWAREDSNLQPSGYEPLALTIELRARATPARVTPNVIIQHKLPGSLP
jgi:hypothetical protein